MYKLLLAVLAVLCFCSAAFGQYVKVLGVAERSGKVVTSGISSTNSASLTYPLSTIDVYFTGTTNHVPIFSNASGSVKSNPYTADSAAVYDFFVAAGTTFDVRVSGVSNGVTITPFTRAGYTAPGTAGITLALCSGTNDTSLLSTLSAAGGTIEIPNGTTCASNSQTLSAAIQVDNGGLLKPLTGQTVTLTGPQTAHAWQTFTNATSGLGTIAFTGNVNLGTVYAAWWGASAAAQTAGLIAYATSSSGVFQDSQGTVFSANTARLAIPLPAPGKVTLADAGAGSLSVGTYKIGVVAVNSEGGEGQFDPVGYNPGASAGITIGANHNISVSWQAVSKAAKYHVYVWGPSGSYYQRFYETASTSLTISTNPVGPVGALSVTPSNTGGSLRAGTYYFDVEAEFADGVTVDQSTNGPAIQAGTVTGTDTGSVALSWSALTGATQYRVYIISEQDGNPRIHTKYFTTASNSVTVTGTETYVRGVQASQFHGNPETESSAVGTFGSVRTVSNSKNFFAADIQIAAAKSADAQFQANRFDINGNAGLSMRQAGAELWAVGIQGTSQDFFINDSITTRFAIRNGTGVTDIIGTLQVEGNQQFAQANKTLSWLSADTSISRINLFNTTYGIGIDTTDLSIFAPSGASTGITFHATSVTGTALMRIQGDGKVGIGTTSPVVTLDVAGQGRFSGALMESEGAVLTISGNVLTVTNNVHHVGAGLIKTINAPTNFVGCVSLIPDSAFTYDATGNVVVAGGGGTATVNRVMIACFSTSSSKWYMSY